MKEACAHAPHSAIVVQPQSRIRDTMNIGIVPISILSLDWKGP